MKYIIVILIGLFSQTSFAQNKTIAFVNVNAVVDSCMKYNNDGAEEIKMMESILLKKKDELEKNKKDNSSNKEAIKTLEADILEYEKRIEARKNEIAEYAEKEKESERKIFLEKVKKTSTQIAKKKKYSDYKDVSLEKPIYYNSEDDITNEVWLKIKG